MSSVTSITFDYTVSTEKSFDEAVDAVVQGVAAAGFRVLHVHDVAGTFREKGVERDPYKIIETCNVKYASKALAADIRVGLMMPCKINVYIEQGKTKISLLLPSLMAAFFPEAGLEGLGAEVEGILRGVVDAAK